MARPVVRFIQVFAKGGSARAVQGLIPIEKGKAVFWMALRVVARAEHSTGVAQHLAQAHQQKPAKVAQMGRQQASPGLFNFAISTL